MNKKKAVHEMHEKHEQDKKTACLISYLHHHSGVIPIKRASFVWFVFFVDKRFCRLITLRPAIVEAGDLRPPVVHGLQVKLSNKLPFTLPPLG